MVVLISIHVVSILKTQPSRSTNRLDMTFLAQLQTDYNIKILNAAGKG